MRKRRSGFPEESVYFLLIGAAIGFALIALLFTSPVLALLSILCAAGSLLAA